MLLASKGWCEPYKIYYMKRAFEITIYSRIAALKL